MHAHQRGVLDALRTFADSVKAKFAALAAGEPEEQLRAPFEQFIGAVGKALARGVVAKGESVLPGRLGRPDMT